jgi:hypothetical protein
MHTRGRWTQISVPKRRHTGHIVLVALLLTVTAGCTSPSSAKGTLAVTDCGLARTAANVPVHVEVVMGHLSCSTALSVEKKYASAIRSGLAPGNGGGGPVKVSGWTCEGYATPVVLHTGKASKCVDGSDEILAILATTT